VIASSIVAVAAAVVSSSSLTGACNPLHEVERLQASDDVPRLGRNESTVCDGLDVPASGFGEDDDVHVNLGDALLRLRRESLIARDLTIAASVSATAPGVREAFGNVSAPATPTTPRGTKVTK
jgi:hypothetical protein